MGRPALTLDQIEFIYVDKTKTCWQWRGLKNKITGYGKFTHFGKTFLAHRFFYENYKGKIPKGLQTDHLCRNRLCVNPKHLEAVTPRENMLRSDNPAAKKARQTHCIRQHPLSGDNLYMTPDGRRQCKKCGKLRNNRRSKH